MPSRKSRNCRNARNRKTRRMVGGGIIDKFNNDILAMRKYIEEMRPTLEELSEAYDNLLKEGANTLAAAEEVAKDFKPNLEEITISRDKTTNLSASAEKVWDNGFKLERMAKVLLIHPANALYNKARDLGDDAKKMNDSLKKLLHQKPPEFQHNMAKWRGRYPGLTNAEIITRQEAADAGM